MKHNRGWFASLASVLSHAAGKSGTFALAVTAVILWALSGPVFRFSDTWQLVINTSTTIITFLMVFLIQNAQNRDTAAIQAKLDELIRATSAQNAMIGIEDLDDEKITELHQTYSRLAETARGQSDTAAKEGLDSDSLP